MLGEDRGDEFTLEKIEQMDIDYAAAMQRRAQVHAEIESGRRAQRAQTGEVFVSLTSLLGSRRASAPAPTRPLLVAVASAGGGLVNQHFGHAREFLVYEASAASGDTDVRFIGVRRVDQYCTGNDTCGDTETALARTIRALDGCEVVLCSRIGIEPWDRLEAAGITPNGEHAMEPIEQSVAAVHDELAAAGSLCDATTATALSA
jgi:nitrogen fixation protein NifB